MEGTKYSFTGVVIHCMMLKYMPLLWWFIPYVYEKLTCIYSLLSLMFRFKTQKSIETQMEIKNCLYKQTSYRASLPCQVLMGDSIRMQS